jgi:hypothetical protein
VFTETASGARTDRPTLTQLLDQLRPGDTLIVWKLDRLGRSLRHLVDTVTGLADRGIGFPGQEAMDTTPGGKLVFHVFAALAEFERTLHQRIALDGPDDELKELADTFDQMLTRLDAAFDSPAPLHRQRRPRAAHPAGNQPHRGGRRPGRPRHLPGGAARHGRTGPRRHPA